MKTIEDTQITDPSFRSVEGMDGLPSDELRHEAERATRILADVLGEARHDVTGLKVDLAKDTDIEWSHSRRGLRFRLIYKEKSVALTILNAKCMADREIWWLFHEQWGKYLRQWSRDALHRLNVALQEIDDGRPDNGEPVE
ncbi:hypothetical protein [Stratiformator vulcanicus]|uniref:Uncharacterized protein n=1 Tax=Stratiformator vulcanicus TaxID=2527980 RepID=A0A517R6A2_9PLAN|nr:hypothetical protein [Stratiformator vulcanicus]QDT39382.1 hypothetical protein Pan189_37890 [Stratiformator vulcanicus]